MKVLTQLLEQLPSLRGRDFHPSKSHHRQLIADFARILNKLVVNRAILDSELSDDAVARKANFLARYFTSNGNKHLLAQIKSSIISPIIENIHNAIQSCSDQEKPRFTSIISSVFTQPQLRELGCTISKQSFASGNRHFNEYGAGAPIPSPPCISNERILNDDECMQLQTFLRDHSYPASNRCSIVNNESVPTRYLDRTYAELHRLWIANNRVISMSYFRKCVRSFRVFKPPHVRGTDLCSTCHQGKVLQSRINTFINQHDAVCQHRVFVQSSVLAYAPSDERPTATLSQVIVDTANFNESNVPPCRCHVNRTCSIQSIKSLVFYFHHSALRTQSRLSYNDAISNIQPNECIITIDWKENIAINRGPVELSQHFYHRSMRSVFGCMLVYRDPITSEVQHRYVDLVSESLSHDSISAFEQLQLALLDTLPQLQHIKTLHIWSDTGPHFRSQEFLCNVLFVLPQTLLDKGCSVEINHHFFVEAHGKSPVDAHFSLLSVWLQELCQRTFVVTTDELLTGLESCAQAHIHRPDVSVRFIHYRPACSGSEPECSHFQSPTNGPVPMEIDDGNPTSDPSLDSRALHRRLNNEGRTQCTRKPFFRHSIGLRSNSARLYYHWKAASDPGQIRFPNQLLAQILDPSQTAVARHENRVSIQCSVIPPALSQHQPTKLDNLLIRSVVEREAPIAFASRLQPAKAHFGSRTMSILKARANCFSSLNHQSGDSQLVPGYACV